MDQGTIQAPSSWSVLGGVLNQTSDIYGGSTASSDPAKPGTFIVTGDPEWANTVTSVRLRNSDDDGIGVMFRVADPNNYYRFSMDRELSYRRLTKTVAGITTTLAEDSVPYAIDTGYDVAIRAFGSALAVYLDGAPILAATDSSLASGRIGLYSWRSTGAQFDNVVVAPSLPTPPVLVVHGLSNAFDADLFASAWPGRRYQLAFSRGT